MYSIFPIFMNAFGITHTGNEELPCAHVQERMKLVIHSPALLENSNF